MAKGFRLLIASLTENPTRKRREVAWLVEQRVDALTVYPVRDREKHKTFEKLEQSKISFSEHQAPPTLHL